MDEDRRCREYILHIILIGSIALLAILDVFVLFNSIREGPAYQEISFELFSVLPVFSLLLYALARRGYSDLASYLLIGAYLTGNSYIAYEWGVAMQAPLIVYALIIIMATILCGTRFGFFITSLIAVFIVAQAQGPHTTDAIVFSILYFLIMIIAWLYEREMERALKRQHDLLKMHITGRTAELDPMQLEKMQQLNRFAELGQLSSGLFHDLLNLLNALSLRPADDGTNLSPANGLNTTGQIKNFMQAMRKQIGGATEESFSLTQGVGHVIQLVNYQATRGNVRIAVHHDRRTDIMQFGVPFKFQEIVINLLLNAIESYEDLPHGDARTKTVDITIAERDGAATLRVRDNGSGMAPEVQARIFEPFFTTKNAPRGIGIGLATIKKIIEEDLFGTIAAESEPGKGSLFIVTFPLCRDFPKDHEGHPAPGERP